MTRIVLAVVGALVTMLLGLCVPRILTRLRDEIEIPSISRAAEVEQKWKQLHEHPRAGGTWVGHLERLLMYGLLFLEPKDAAAAIGIWVAFKLAAKWEAWNNIARVPEQLDEHHSVDKLDYAIGRRKWAAQSYATFVVGTGANFIAAGFGTATRVGLTWFLCGGT